MHATRWARFGSVLLLGLVLGCGGGGGDGFDDGITRGTYYTNVEIFTDPCGPVVREVMGSSVFEEPENRVRLVLYMDGTPGCSPATLTIHGTRTGPSSIDVDDLPGAWLCALQEEYGYGTFDITNAVYTEEPTYDRITGDFTAAYDGGTCSGDIYITLSDR